MASAVYQETDLGIPAYRIGDAGPGYSHFAVVELNGHGLRIQSRSVEELADLAAVITKAAVELGNAQRAETGVVL